MEELNSFLGKWEEEAESKQGFDEVAKAVGLPEDKIDLYKQSRTAISYTKKDDQSMQIEVGLVGDCVRTFDCTLGQGYQSSDVDGTPMKSLVKADGKTLTEEHTYEDGLMKGAQMCIKRWIEGDNMKVKTEMCGKSMVSTYKRI